MKLNIILTAALAISLLTQTNSYFLGDLVSKLNGYSKSWKSGINSKFINMSL